MGTVTRYRVSFRGDDAIVREAFPEAVVVAAGEVEVRVGGLPALNHALATLIGRGVLVVAVTPAHSALEERFRQSVRSDL